MLSIATEALFYLYDFLIDELYLYQTTLGCSFFNLKIINIAVFVKILENQEGRLVLKHKPTTTREYSYFLIGISVLLICFLIISGPATDGGVLVIALVFASLGIILFVNTPVTTCTFDKGQVIIEHKYFRKTEIIKKSIDEILRVDLKEIVAKSSRNYVIILIFQTLEEIKLNPDNSEKKIAEDAFSLILLFLESKNN